MVDISSSKQTGTPLEKQSVTSLEQRQIGPTESTANQMHVENFSAGGNTKIASADVTGPNIASTELVHNLEIPVGGNLAERLATFKKQRGNFKASPGYNNVVLKLAEIDTKAKAKAALLAAKEAAAKPTITRLPHVPDVITVYQKAIKGVRPEEINNTKEILWDLCDNMMKDSSKIQYVDDGYGKTGVYFPELGYMQRIAYLSVGSMKQGEYENGTNHYKQYSVNYSVPGMSRQEKVELIYKNTLDTLPQEFTDALDADMYQKGYRWKTLTDANKMFAYLAKELGLSFQENTTNDQNVVKAYIYLTGAVTKEWLNTDWDSKKDGDTEGKLDGKLISGRAVVDCLSSCQSFNRSYLIYTSCAIPLLKEIV